MTTRSFLLIGSITLAIVLVGCGGVMEPGDEQTVAAAARGSGKTTTASIKLDQSDPHLGGLVTFTTVGGSRIALSCFQGGIGNGVFTADQPTGTAFLLGGASSVWLSVGGSADCYAWLYTQDLSRGALAAAIFTAAGAR